MAETLEGFASNLKLLCSFYPSIAEVTRRLGVNRSQFNKYLTGRHRPSPHLLRRLCDFFGVEDYEIFLPHEQFRQIVALRPQDRNATAPLDQSAHNPHLAALMRASSPTQLARYCGYYFEYSYSMSKPGKILRSLAYIGEEGDQVYHQRIERLTPPGAVRRPIHCKYKGVTLFLHDRLFLIDYESLTANEVSQTILYPAYQNRITRLTGLKMGAAAREQRTPACTRVLWDYLGRNIQPGRAFRHCGLYSPDDPEIDASIRPLIDNSRTGDPFAFVAEAQ